MREVDMPEVGGFSLDKRVSLGNVIVLLGMIVSMSMAWSNITAKTNTVAEQTRANATLAASNEMRIRLLEQQLVRQEERSATIVAQLTKIDAALGRIEQSYQNVTRPSEPLQQRGLNRENQ